MGLGNAPFLLFNKIAKTLEALFLGVFIMFHAIVSWRALSKANFVITVLVTR